tara:strand:+ start:47 stop:766 length:720 start_codon:yes stop_codon:yes gene_type:complete
MRKILRRLLFKFAGKSNARRDYFIKEWIESLDPGSSLLDAGAGFQRYKKYAINLNYVSQDFAKYEGGEISGGVKVTNWNSKECDIICDIAKIPRDDSSFDNIMCNEVFEHLPNPQEALTELSRLMKRGGRILITAPYRCHSHQEPFFFYTGFSTELYKHYARENNLKFVKIIPNGNYYNELIEELINFCTANNWLHQITSLFLLFPFMCVLNIMARTSSTTTNPLASKSCVGYFVILEK